MQYYFNFFSFFKKVCIGFFSYVIVPPFCAACRQYMNVRTTFCTQCMDSITPLVSKAIPITKQYSLKVVAMSSYADPIKSLILSKSYGNLIAASQLGHLIHDYTHFDQMACDYLIPVPLHWRRFAKRGYNQADEIAYVLSQKQNIPIADIIRRVKNTPFQSSLPLGSRPDNVKDVFRLKECNTHAFAGKHLVIVDDLMTTGATLIQVARELTKLNPASISAIVAARAE